MEFVLLSNSTVFSTRSSSSLSVAPRASVSDSNARETGMVSKVSSGKVPSDAIRRGAGEGAQDFHWTRTKLSATNGPSGLTYILCSPTREVFITYLH